MPSTLARVIDLAVATAIFPTCAALGRGGIPAPGRPAAVPASSTAVGAPLSAQTAQAPSPFRNRPNHLAPGTPLVIAHRGASGYRPEHTIAAYELAVAMGADYFEPDLVMTKDGILVDRHEPEFSGTTDVASHPEFASRKTTKALDGVATTGWFAEDFTLAELKTLRAVERLPALRQHNTLYDGLFEVTTYEEDLKLREALSKKYHREIGIIPEIKHSTYLHDKGLDPERTTIALTATYKLNKKNAPMWIQSFEYSNLKRLRDLGYQANLVFLADAAGGPYDLVAKGTPRSYDDLMKPAGLRELAQWCNGVAPYKERVIPRDAAGNLGTPTSLVADAHAAGMSVTLWTFRAENNWLPKNLQVGRNPADYGRAVDEIAAYLRTGIDAFFTDQADIGVLALPAPPTSTASGPQAG